MLNTINHRSVRFHLETMLNQLLDKAAENETIASVTVCDGDHASVNGLRHARAELVDVIHPGERRYTSMRLTLDIPVYRNADIKEEGTVAEMETPLVIEQMV